MLLKTHRRTPAALAGRVRSDVGASGASVANGAATIGFNRNEEIAADKQGLALYTQMGYDPRQFRRVFEILKEKYGDGGVLSTHPKNSERIKQVDDLTAAMGSSTPARPFRSNDVDEFRQIQAIVAAQEQSTKCKPVVGDRAFANQLMICFDYCVVHQKQSPRGHR